MYKSKLAEVIITEGITGASIIKKTGLASATIYRAINGKRKPNLTNQHLIVKRINDILAPDGNYSVEDVFPK